MQKFDRNLNRSLKLAGLGCLFLLAGAFFLVVEPVLLAIIGTK